MKKYLTSKVFILLNTVLSINYQLCRCLLKCSQIFQGWCILIQTLPIQRRMRIYQQHKMCQWFYSQYQIYKLQKWSLYTKILYELINKLKLILITIELSIFLNVNTKKYEIVMQNKKQQLFCLVYVYFMLLCMCISGWYVYFLGNLRYVETEAHFPKSRSKQQFSFVLT